MKKAIVLSAVLLLVSSPSFAATTFNSKHACEFKTHGACVQDGANWVASPTTTAPAAAATTPTTTPTTTTATTPAAPAAPAAPTVTTAQPAQTKSGWFSSFGNKSAPSAPAAEKAAQKPVDPRQVARGKVYGSQGSCQGETGGNCVATDCATHVGGVCEGNKSVVWSYAH